nr:craniofacial development protein 2-like [Nicotiana tomentosiformis]
MVTYADEFLQHRHRRGRVNQVALCWWMFRDGWEVYEQTQQSRPTTAGITVVVCNGRVGSCPRGTLTGKSIELAKILQNKKVNIAYVQETSAYAPQSGLDEEVKRHFWEGLDEVVQGIPATEKLFIRGDFNGHIGSSTGGYGEVHGGFGFRDRNGGGTSLLDFARAFELVIANSTFPKREEYLVTFRSMMAKTQIDYILLRRCDRGLCEDCKVIPSENLATQHRLLVMDVCIVIKRKKRFVRGQPRIRWGALAKDNTHELEGKLMAMGA